MGIKPMNSRRSKQQELFYQTNVKGEVTVTLHGTYSSRAPFKVTRTLFNRLNGKYREKEPEAVL
jgi:hypothetical protein